jgi:hypothetical protein
MEVSLLDSKHVTLLPAKGCSSPNSLTVLPLYQVFCWQRLHSVLLFFLRCSFYRTRPSLQWCSPRALAWSSVRRSRCLTFTRCSFSPHSLSLGRPVLLPPVPPIRAVSLSSFWKGSTPPQGPIHDSPRPVGSLGRLFHAFWTVDLI